MNIYGCYPIFEKSGWQQSAFVRPLSNGDIAFTRFNVQSWIWFYYGIKTRMLGHVTALFLMCVASQTLKYTYVIPTDIIFYNCYQI